MKKKVTGKPKRNMGKSLIDTRHCRNPIAVLNTVEDESVINVDLLDQQLCKDWWMKLIRVILGGALALLPL
jgi:hypothetical protein